jgi:DNA (cytosine-5)-methyltransferase 1
MSKPRAIDLFAGAGGLTQGLKDAGFSVVAAVEIDPLAVKTYSANHRRVLLFEEDINALKPSRIMKTLGLKRGGLDLLAGCPPCQGFSRMRNLNGGRRVRDPQTKDLVIRFLAYIEAFYPKVVMMENVPGLEKDIRFRRLKTSLRYLGYSIVLSEVRDAQNCGVPQRRRRLIFIASRIGKFKIENPMLPKKTVKDSIGHLPMAGTSGDPLHDMPEHRVPKVMAMIRDIPKDGGSRGDLPKNRQLPCHQSFKGFRDVYGRMPWNDVAPTITGGCFNPSKGRFLHPVEDRAITMREAALLQSFPEDYVFPPPLQKQAIALMIGNALPPRFIRHHAMQIRIELESSAKPKARHLPVSDAATKRIRTVRTARTSRNR